MRRELAGTFLRIEERIAMRNLGAAHHAAENRAQPRVSKHVLCEDDEGVMHIVLGYGGGNAVQVSRGQCSESPTRTTSETQRLSIQRLSS
jgi:hypothetical protein